MYVVVDWLQLHVIVGDKQSYAYNSMYTVKTLAFQTRHFKTIEEIYFGQKLIATCCRNPHSKVLDERMMLIKFDNAFLYQKELKFEAEYFLKLNKLKLEGISRLDIAHDFNLFFNDMNPEDLIKRFLRGYYSKLGKSKFSVLGEHNDYNIYEYIKFGTNKSPICVYLYNKSVEMQQVKLKPWICDTWKLCNLDISKDVWRLEFKLSSANKQLINTESGECLSLKTLDILNPQALFELYIYCLEKYFVILKTGTDTNKSRMKRIKLFDYICDGSTLARLTDKISSNRSDKIFLNKLNSLNDELRGTDTAMRIMCNDLSSYYATSRGLSEWSRNKLLL